MHMLPPSLVILTVIDVAVGPSLAPSLVPSLAPSLVQRFVDAHGERRPAYPKPLAWSADGDGDIRVGQITVSDKPFTQAEVAWGAPPLPLCSVAANDPLR